MTHTLLPVMNWWTAGSNWMFSRHQNWASWCKKQKHPKRGPKKCCHHGSPNTRNPPLPSRDTTQKMILLTKCMLRCPSAQELEPVAHTASAEKEDFMLQAQTATGTYISRWTAPELIVPPGNTWKSYTRHCQTAWCPVPESNFPETGNSGNLHCWRTVVLFKFLDCERKKLQFSEQHLPRGLSGIIMLWQLWKCMNARASSKHKTLAVTTTLPCAQHKALGMWLI